MTRREFMSALRRGLRGLPQATLDEIADDYESHFSEGASAGRTEAQVAAALGNPSRLARELRAEAGLRRWEQERNPSAAGAAVLAVLGLATIDVLFLAPVLFAIGGVLFGLFVAAVAIIGAGAAVVVAGLFGQGWAGNLDILTGALVGLGLMCLGVALGALLIPVVVGLLNLLGRYGRLHYRLLQPALKAAEEDKP